MPYELLPSQEDNLLFFHLEGEAAERYGFVGYLRADFGRNGRDFWTTWFDQQPHLKTPAFKDEFDEMINSLRDDGQKPPFASRDNLAAFCAATPGKELTTRGSGYMVRTLDFSYYVRCLPRPGDYDIYAFAFDNRYLLPELAGKHDLPDACYSVLPSTGELISISRYKKGYTRCDGSKPNPRKTACLRIPPIESVALRRRRRQPCLPGVCSVGMFPPQSRGNTTRTAIPGLCRQRRMGGAMRGNDALNTGLFLFSFRK